MLLHRESSHRLNPAHREAVFTVGRVPDGRFDMNRENSVVERLASGGTSRRAVLAGAGGVCAAALLAACSSSNGSSGSGSSTGGTSSTASKDLGPTSAIPVGGGKVFTDQGVVVTQPESGTFKGFTNMCTHQQNPVGSVSDGTINRPFHGSKFSIKDGSVVNGPANTALPEKTITVANGEITLG